LFGLFVCSVSPSFLGERTTCYRLFGAGNCLYLIVAYAHASGRILKTKIGL